MSFSKTTKYFYFRPVQITIWFQISGQENNIWSVNDYALRDLLVHLVQKYRIDEVYDSKMKAQNWEKLIQVRIWNSVFPSFSK